MRPRISTTTSPTDPKRARQHAVHAGVCRQGGAERPEPLPQVRLQVSRDGDHDRGGLAVDQLVDQGNLLVWSEGSLQDNDLVAIPGAAPGSVCVDGLHGDTEPSGSGSNALREQEIIFHDKETPGHGCRIAG
jgi:hypothetical protein